MKEIGSGSAKFSRWRVTLRLVVVLAIVPFGFVLYQVGRACVDYHRVSQYEDWWSGVNRSVARMAWWRVRASLGTAWADRVTLEDDGREVVDLRVDPAAWKAMTEDVPAHWGEWVDAELVRGGRQQRVKIRLRGDACAHFITPKKSISIKTRKGEPYLGLRRLNLTVKSVLGQYVSSSLATDFDLLAPATAVVPVFVNGSFHGLHRLMGRPDEHFLRSRGRIPGNVYRGEALMRGDAFKNLPNELFANPYLWDRTAEIGEPGASGDRRLLAWISDLSGSTFEEHERLWSWLDRRELSRLLALMLVCGDPHHMSGQHNQFWYEDPSSGKMHPIVWDLLIENLETPRSGATIHRLWRAVLRDPRVMDGALELVAQWADGDRLLGLARERADAAEAAHHVAFAYDRSRAGVICNVAGAQSVMFGLRRNLEVLERWLRQAEVAFGFGATAGGPSTLDLSSSGRVGSVLEALVLDVAAATDVRLWADSNLDGVLDPDDRRVDVSATPENRGWRLHLKTPEVLLSGCAAAGPEFVPEPIHYRFFVEAVDDAGTSVPIGAIRPELSGRFSDHPPRLTVWNPGAAIRTGSTWHPWRYRSGPMAEVRLEGEVHLTEDLVVDEDSVLHIAPGTRVALGPGVSILIRGRVVAGGTAQSPIVISAAVVAQPWGVFALQGAGANGSRLEYVRFVGGGGAQLDRVAYRGSVCVHNAAEVEFEACEFEADARCDSLLSVVRADVDLQACVFDSASQDAIDYDRSTGRIVRCRISNAGENGIALLGRDPRVVSTTIDGCGGAGIAVGGEAAPLIFDCGVTACRRGIEVTGFAAPVILDSEVTGHVIGILQRRDREHLAAAGRAVLVESRVGGNQVDYDGRDEAVLTVSRQEGGAPSSVVWLRRAFGIEVDGTARGRPSTWRAVAPARVMASESFVEGFGDPSAGWSREGSVRHVRRGRRDLVASFDAGRGTVRRAVPWQLPDDGSRYALVLAAAGRALLDGEVTVTAAGGATRSALIVDDDVATARFTTIELPPGDYRTLTLSASASAAGAELRLCGWRVLALAR